MRYPTLDQTHQTECRIHIEFRTNARFSEHLSETLGHNIILGGQ